MKLEEYAMYWYQTYRMPKQQKTTQQTCLSLIRNHIIGSELGALELEDVKAADIQRFLTDQLMHGCKIKLKHYSRVGKPLSTHSIVKLRQILIAMYRQAQKEDVVIKNVAEDTERLPLPWKESPVFTPEAQRKFLAATRSRRFYAAYVLLFFLGLRRSELLALTWDAIDLRRNTVSIKKALVMEGNDIVLRNSTKTRASIRVLPIPQEIKFVLQDHKKKQKEEARAFGNGYHNEFGLLFTSKDGSPYNPNYFSRNFKNLIKHMSFLSDNLHLHSTRHTWATNMLQCGATISDAQALGGWSRPDTLLNVYAHSVKESQRRAMKKLYKEISAF